MNDDVDDDDEGDAMHDRSLGGATTDNGHTPAMLRPIKHNNRSAAIFVPYTSRW